MDNLKIQFENTQSEVIEPLTQKLSFREIIDSLIYVTLQVRGGIICQTLRELYVNYEHEPILFKKMIFIQKCSRSKLRRVSDCLCLNCKEI